MNRVQQFSSEINRKGKQFSGIAVKTLPQPYIVIHDVPGDRKDEYIIIA